MWILEKDFWEDRRITKTVVLGHYRKQRDAFEFIERYYPEMVMDWRKDGSVYFRNTDPASNITIGFRQPNYSLRA